MIGLINARLMHDCLYKPY